MSEVGGQRPDVGRCPSEMRATLLFAQILRGKEIESQIWEQNRYLDFAKDCGYLSASDHKHLAEECREVGAMLGAMLKNPSQFLIRGF